MMCYPCAVSYTHLDVYKRQEYMFLGLRKIEGVSKTDFRQTFGRSIENAYGKVLIDMYQKQLLEDTGEYIRLTEKGIDVSNYVMSEFLF